MADASQYVLVGCKAPNGLILNLDRYERQRPDSNEVRRINSEQRVTLLGWSHEFNKPDPTESTGGYRLNRVPADFWAEWSKINAKSPLIADGIILPPPSAGATQAASGHSKAREHAEHPRMFDKLDPAGDARGGNIKPFDRAA